MVVRSTLMAFHDLAVGANWIPLAACSESAASLAFPEPFTFAAVENILGAKLVYEQLECGPFTVSFSGEQFALSFCFAFAANDSSSTSCGLLHIAPPFSLVVLIVPEELLCLLVWTTIWQVIHALTYRRNSVGFSSISTVFVVGLKGGVCTCILACGRSCGLHVIVPCIVLRLNDRRCIGRRSLIPWVLRLS